ncbi:ROMO1 protein, partial [Formicarius rufipectus]|nr:ROMO1 protein [Formicarius rufipectus]
DRIKMGFMMGFAVGMAAGALFGTFSCLRSAERDREWPRGLGMARVGTGNGLG